MRPHFRAAIHRPLFLGSVAFLTSFTALAGVGSDCAPCASGKVVPVRVQFLSTEMYQDPRFRAAGMTDMKAWGHVMAADGTDAPLVTDLGQVQVTSPQDLRQKIIDIAGRRRAGWGLLSHSIHDDFSARRKGGPVFS